MRESNQFHKFKGYLQKQSGNVFDDLQYQFYFDYYDSEQTKSIGYMFKNLPFGAASVKLITEYNRDYAVNDRIYIDEEPSLITAIHVVEKQKLGGQRFKNRKKIYIIELEV